MKRNTLLHAIFGALLACSMTAVAQEKGNWRAASTTARSITGDVALSDEKISINFSSFPIARVRSLLPSELSAIFEADSSAGGNASLYRLDIPATKKFLRHNTLCGSDDVKWMVTYASGHSLQLAFFSAQTPPVLTPEAIAQTTDLCGTFSYAK